MHMCCCFIPKISEEETGSYNVDHHLPSRRRRLCLSEDSAESDTYTDSDDSQRDIESVPRGHKAKRLFQRQLKSRTREVDDIIATLEQKPLHIPTSVLSWACADDSCHEH